MRPVTEYPLFRHQPHTLNLTNRLIELSRSMVSNYSQPPPSPRPGRLLAKQVLSGHGENVKLAGTLHGTDISPRWSCPRL